MDDFLNSSKSHQAPFQRKLRLGMVGGGEGAYIGGIHRLAARLDDQYQLVAGAFDVDAQKGHDFAQRHHVAPDRSYDDYVQMAQMEALRDDKIDVVAICTPNHTHFPIAKAFLEKGFHVICEKPMTATYEDALALNRLVEQTNLFLGVTYTYSGYPMIHEARERIAAGELGKIRVIQVEYPLEWMASNIEQKGNAQAAWRTDPRKNGRGGSIGDIGTHAYHLAYFVSGLDAEMISADLATFVEGRALDDNAHVLIRYKGGARGMLWSSQVAIGHSNGLKLRIFGEKASISWFQEAPNELIFSGLNQETKFIKRGQDNLSLAARVRSRTPAGHPEGYIEAFSNLYLGFAKAISAKITGQPLADEWKAVPNQRDGLHGVEFVEAVVDSHEKHNNGWVKLPLSQN